MSTEKFSEFRTNYHMYIRTQFNDIRPMMEYLDTNIQEANIDLIEIKQDVSLDSGMIEFYSVVQFWQVKWKSKGDNEIEGSFNILPLEKVMIGDVDFYPDDFPRMKNFTLLDYFFNEAAVGFYLDKPELGLFYFEFDSNPRPLNLDFNGYLEMLKYTKGYAYWQLSVLTLAAGHQLARTDIYDKVTALFPTFSAKGLEDLYNSVKLK